MKLSCYWFYRLITYATNQSPYSFKTIRNPIKNAMKKTIVIFLFIMCDICYSNTIAQTPQPAKMKYPETRKDSVSDNYFGTIVHDSYRWLENDTSAETAQWVKAENAVTQEYLSKIPFRQKISDRYEGIFNYEKYSAPFKQGNFIYYYKNSGLQNQFVVYRELYSGGEPELFLDPNTFSKDGTTSLGALNFSKDASMAAYNISEGGSDWQKMLVMDAINKKLVGDTMQDIKFGSAAWKGNVGFFYSTYDRPKEGSFLGGVTDNHKLLFHKVGTPQSEDKLIYGGPSQPRRYISAVLTEDEKWLIIYGAKATYGNELLVLDLTHADAKPIALVSDMANRHFIIDSDESNFFIQTDRKAPNGKLVIVSQSTPQEENWKDLVPEKSEALSASSGGGYLFCSYLKDAITKVYQYDRKGKEVREILLPGLGSADGFGAKQEELKRDREKRIEPKRDELRRERDEQRDQKGIVPPSPQAR